MKPVSVTFKCFGPYMEQQHIDFAELEKNGLFLICGETGAGKTTILDAICYALYGEASGGQRGGLEEMRCKLAGKSDETAVEFIFESNGHRYKFSRSMKYKTKNLSINHSCSLWLDGVWEVLETKQKQVNARAEKLVGLTSSQFRQVIILPQGKFEEFLVSNSDKKEEILVTLFNVQQWSRISAEISRRVNARGTQLDRERAAIAEGLARHGCDDLAALDARGQQMERDLEELIPQAKLAEQTEKELRDNLQLQLQVAKAYEELDKRQKNYAQMLSREGEIRLLEQSLALADQAEQVREPYEAFCAARNAFRREEEAVRRGEKRTAAEKQALLAAQSRLEAHLAREQDMAQKQSALLRLENAAPIYQNLQDLRRAENEAREEADRRGRLLTDQENALAQRERELAAAFDARNLAEAEYKCAQERYRRGIGGILAATLEDGMRCPVCGSLEHPHPAPMSEDPVSDAQLDKLSKAANKADKAATAALKARGLAETARSDAQRAKAEADQSLAAAQAGCRSAKEQKIPGIETVGDLNRAAAGLKTELQAWNDAGKVLLDAKTEAQGREKAAQLSLEEARTACTAAGQVYEEQTALWETACAAAGFSSETDFLAASLDPREKQRRRKQAADFRSDLKVAESALEEQRRVVEGKPLEDIPKLQEALSQAENRRKELTQRQILLDSEIRQLRADEKALSARQEKNREALIALEADRVFASRLQGSRGVGLQRYVLGVMMNSITAQANRLLENVYGGRYRLHRTDESSGAAHKTGLELEVFDGHNGQRRSVRTLSGGEKFLVALSLAIGLSTVVQAQGEGIRLEAMFIDEGFGSLDREAIQDALDILQGIRGSAGVVGIISHVEALAETIPTRIEITKGRQGSRSRIISG